MTHQCFGALPRGGYGEAINSCEEEKDGTLWVSNGEYASQVLFCPYCGFKAHVLPSGYDRTIPYEVFTAIGRDLDSVASKRGLERYPHPETDSALRERIVNDIRGYTP